MQSTSLPDIQRTKDLRNVTIQRVGVTGIKMPVRVLRPDADLGGISPVDLCTVGEFELTCLVPSDVKGTHMSRFTEVLNQHVDLHGVFSHSHLITLAKVLANRMESSVVDVKLKLDYFTTQNAPASGRAGVAPCRAFLGVKFTSWRNGTCRVELTTGVEVQGKTCCPCSREISDFDHETGKGKGAHAQRSTINLTIKHSTDTMLWFEELIAICAKSFSSPVYPVLKRPDEKAVTEGAYGNPKFVEDVIRDVVVGLRDMPRFAHITEARVHVQNAESIHYHDAIAETIVLPFDTAVNE